MPERSRFHRANRVGGVGLLAVLALVMASAWAGDPTTAKSLLGSAKDALEQKKFDTALNLLAKAKAEDPELLDVGYWLGLTHDKKGDAQAAVREYRGFREATNLAQKRSALTKDQAELVKKMQVRLTALAPGETEEARLRATLSSELLALAKGKEAKDKAAAAIALDALLVAYPDHDEAVEVLARVTQPPPRKGEFGLPEALKGIGPWNDMIAKTPFGDIPNWKYEDPGLVIVGGKGLHGAAEPIFVEGNIVLDLEVRLVEITDPGFSVGWGLVARPDNILCHFREGRVVALIGLDTTGTGKVVAQVDVPNLKPGTWHRLTLQVQDKKVQMWVDGGKPSVFTADVLGPKTQMCLGYGGCKAELRTFRWARAR